MKKTLSVVFLFTFLAAAADEPKAPQLSAEQRAKFWRARTEQVTAQAAFEVVVKDLQATCGAGYIVNYDQAGEPSCQKQSVPPAVPAVPPAK